MENQYTLAELVELADEELNLDSINDLIIRLYTQNDDEALELIIKLAFFNYGGMTYKSDFQNLGVVRCLHWGVHGIKQLATATIANDGYRAINNVTRMLSNLSAGSLDKLYLLEKPCIHMLDITNSKYKTAEWTTGAKEALVEVMMSVEKSDPFPIAIIQNMGFFASPLASEHLFAALIQDGLISMRVA